MWLQFTDGRAGIVDFSDDLWGEDLEPLRDPITFAELTLDEGLATLSWERRRSSWRAGFECRNGPRRPAAW